MRLILSFFFLSFFFASCSTVEKSKPVLTFGSLQSTGGTIHFSMVLDTNNHEKPGYVLNGPDSLKFNRISYKNDSVLVHFDALDSFFALDKSLEKGRWEKKGSKNRRISLPFQSEQNPPAPAQKADRRFDGEWNVLFYDGENPSTATGVFSFDNGFLRGTFLTETGDYRFLEGQTKENGFELWTFDIAHAYYFTAELQADSSLSGQFFPYADAPIKWTAVRGKNALRDPMTTTKLRPDAKITFAFPDLAGNMIAHTDAKFLNKPMLVYIFGSWCPNCADESRLIKELSQQFASTDLEIVGLAFEYSGDPAEDAEMVKRYRNRFGVTWTTLLAGTSDKTDASAKIPFVEKVVSFPTSFFVRRDGSIAAVHTGFSGPGTGAYHNLERQRFIAHLEEILRP